MLIAVLMLSLIPLAYAQNIDPSETMTIIYSEPPIYVRVVRAEGYGSVIDGILDGEKYWLLTGDNILYVWSKQTIRSDDFLSVYGLYIAIVVVVTVVAVGAVYFLRRR